MISLEFGATGRIKCINLTETSSNKRRLFDPVSPPVSTLCVSSRGPRILCRFVTTVLTVDVLCHFLAVGCCLATLYTRVAPFSVFPKDASVVGHT